MPTEKMTWEEIKKLYPDEWVLITQPEANESTQVVAGCVFDHNEDHGYIHERMSELKGKGAIAVLFTGKPHGITGFARVDLDPEP
ncbi:hypothetical protein COW64_07220 [bacterium (Candidatus Blackallbacteria) CG18_big_fil_WC_8_21_14_2_50_49_26]|nr:MAG: hypothetical protein COW64_07220 [bacterium (Candidatus Blackallbacteria) CG18_big_fil_WC_8_21_14_2_50_49_26]